MRNSRDAGESLPIFKRKRDSVIGTIKRAKHYIIGDLIGEGSYARVYEAWDEKNERLCAIKVIKKRSLSKTPGGPENLQREIEILKKLNHKNCVHLLDHFTEEEKKIYLVFEHVCGGSVQQLCERAPCKRLPLHQARRIFVQLLDALEYLHKQDIIHRDIKLDNMLLTETGELKLSDFGSAVQLGQKVDEALKRCTGSPAFQPPEILLKENGKCNLSGPMIDIWAAGIALYMMCTGSFPFKSGNLCELVENISKACYCIPSFVDANLSDLLCRTLNKDNTKRLSIQQIRNHQWMSAKLKRAKSIPILTIDSSFVETKLHQNKTNSDCQCSLM